MCIAYQPGKAGVSIIARAQPGAGPDRVALDAAQAVQHARQASRHAIAGMAEPRVPGPSLLLPLAARQGVVGPGDARRDPLCAASTRSTTPSKAGRP